MKKMATMDGNTAAATISYMFTEVATIYPITPSSPMAEVVDIWVSQGKKNIFNEPVKVVEMQSEAGAAGAMHGSLQAGALTSTYTASQGLLLMIPNMYKMAGEMLPGVIHVAARALATSSLNIFGDHQDVMAARQTGFCILMEGSVQEVMDLSAVSHLSAIKAHMPFMNVFDGFRTSHEIQKIEVLDKEDLKKLIDMNALEAFKNKALNPNHPVTRGTAQNSDIYFQTREAVNKYYEDIPKIVEDYMNEIKNLTGREYHAFDYYGAKDAEKIIIAMGSVIEVIEETVDYLLSKGEKVGLVKVRLYRPFRTDYLLKVIPKTVKKIAVLDRTKEPGSAGEPLYLDVLKSFYDTNLKPVIVGGRFGLGSKDPTPANILSVYKNLDSDKPINSFTIGINDDVTNTSLKEIKNEYKPKYESKQCKFWGLGSDGTVGANKSAIKIIGDKTNMFAQGYFYYDSKKSGGLTVSHLRFGNEPIKSPYLIENSDFIACHNMSYVYNYNLLEGLKKGGSFLLNTIWSEEELDEKLPMSMKKYIYDNNINFYTINAVKIAQDIGLGGRINMIMQSAFFKIANIIPIDDAVKYLKEAVVKSYSKKGEKVVKMNNDAIDIGIKSITKVKVLESWKNVKEESTIEDASLPGFIKDIVLPINKEQGNSIPVSTFIKYGVQDGSFMSGTAAYEKRGIASFVPTWLEEKCIQCNQCSYVCPHAVIRPFLLNEQEKNNVPEATKILEGKALKSHEKLYYSIGISPLDCTGCSNCVQVCPAPGKALLMKPLHEEQDQNNVWSYLTNNVSKKNNPMNKYTVKGSQFERPLHEFSGACAGCGETAYAKLITQLFGDRMMIANATGCTSIWGASAPSMPYTKNEKGFGPAFANSLFEDNAEFGFGMYIGSRTIREKIKNDLIKLTNITGDEKFKEIANEWIENMNIGEGTRERAYNLENALKCLKENDLLKEQILKSKDFFVKPSQWIFGGDGWAYDIGYGGLDHVLALNEDVNIFVFDTEVYSNTGGQSSKSTQTGAVAKFAASGKKTKKKDLGMMAMSYGNVYVAQISMGADKNQTIKAIKEAESYNGPSIIIAYSPCINHGIKKGMAFTQEVEKNAVECGYWSLYRYNPEIKEKPFMLDSKEPSGKIEDFLMNEVRYNSLAKIMPEHAKELFEKNKNEALARYNRYKKMSENNF